jgi:hypothetical protein
MDRSVKSIKVDARDEWILTKYKWRVSNLGYAVKGSGDTSTLQNLIMKPSKGKMVDHKDLNRLNCTRSNLRVCTVSQNNCNRAGWNKLGWKGVRDRNGNFSSQIAVNKRSYHLGTFKTPEEAHLSYLMAAIEKHGIFANGDSE